MKRHLRLAAGIRMPEMCHDSMRQLPLKAAGARILPLPGIEKLPKTAEAVSS